MPGNLIPIRSAEVEGEEFYALKDLCVLLDIRSPHRAVKKYRLQPIRVILPDSYCGTRPYLAVSKPEMERLMIRATHPTKRREPGIQWAAVTGFPGYYVSSDGRVWSEFKTDYITRYKRNPARAYLTANLFRDGQLVHHQVHRLVAMAFIPNPLNRPEVNHINENPADNRVENLEWATAQEQALHGTRLDRIAETKRQKAGVHNARTC